MEMISGFRCNPKYTLELLIILYNCKYNIVIYPLYVLLPKFYWLCVCFAISTHFDIHLKYP